MTDRIKNTDKKQENSRKKKLLIRMFSYVFRYKWLALAALLVMLASNILALWGPSLSGKAINAIEAEGGVDIPHVFYFCIMMIIAYTLSALLSYLNSIIMVVLSQKITYTMRREIFEHLTSLPVSYFDRTATGDIISHISYDVDTVNTSLSTDMLQLGAGIVTVVGSLMMMLSISPIMVSVFIFTIPVLFCLRDTRQKRFSRISEHVRVR